MEINWKGEPVIYDGSPANLTQTKVVSAFHQMHCLVNPSSHFIFPILSCPPCTITSAPADPLSQNLIRRSFSVSISDPHIFYYLIAQLTRHWDHCFDYLRQALMCTADTTLEELEMNERGDVIGRVDGWGTEHVCRDWEAVKGWAQGHRGTDDGGID